MNKINRKLEYALMALKHMSGKRPGELTSAKEVSDFYGAPFDALSRTLQLMAQAQILKAVQGPTGGYMIVKDLANVSVHDLIELLLGPLGVAKCLHASEDCEMRSTCNIVTPISVLNNKLVELYRSISILELIGDQRAFSGEQDEQQAQKAIGGIL